MSGAPSPRPPFRPDVEGLRGVAILLVVLYHAGVPGLAGGFVGVDVFFVVSGWFITALLARALATPEGLRVGDFWARRSLRLFPALLVVLLTTLALVQWLWAPIDRATAFDSARAAALSSSNVAFAREAVNYFSGNAGPLLHTWSLAVEEQFYLVWPLILLVAAWLGARRSHDDETRHRALLVGVVVAGLASLALSLHQSSAAPSWAFFGMPSRVWEFALGGALALATRETTAPARWGAPLQLAGLVAIGIAVARYDMGTPYPGVAALLPALGAAALLVGGARAGESTLTRVVSVRPLQTLGRLSYAWYLWHWPLVGVGRVLDRDAGPWTALLWSLVALALAWLTHRLVERPAREACPERSRRGRAASWPTARVSAYALVASVGTALLAWGMARAAERRMTMPDQRAFAAARDDRAADGCWSETADATKACVFGDAHATTTLVLLGDSHAQHWIGGLDRAGKTRGWKIVALVKGGCPVADIPDESSARRVRTWKECVRWREAMLQRIVAMRPTGVILSSWDHYVPIDGKVSRWQVTPEAWRRGLRKTYARLAAAGVPTVAIRGTPRTWFDVPACLSRRAAGLPFATPCTYDRARSLSRDALRAQDDAARGFPVSFVDMNDQVCATPRCEVERAGVVVFTDDNHLTASFSRAVAPTLGARVAAAFAARGVRLR